MKTRLICILLLCITSLCGSAAQPDLPDEQRSAWRLRRGVSTPVTNGFIGLTLPPELRAAAQPDLRDLRLVAADGREIPFVLDRRIERDQTRKWQGELIDTRIERKQRSVWTVDLKEPRKFDLLRLAVSEGDFAKRVHVEISDDGHAWRTAVEDAGVFNRQWRGSRVLHDMIELKPAATARFVRLTVDDRQTAPVELQAATAEATRLLGAQRWTRSCGVTPLNEAGESTRYRIDLPQGLPFDRLQIDSDDAAFARTATVVEETNVNGLLRTSNLGSGTLFRLRADDEAGAAEQCWLDTKQPRGGAIVLTVHNGDSPALHNLRVTVSGTDLRLLFSPETGSNSWTLYYGNTEARTPVYDIETLRSRLSTGAEFARAELGPETLNPRFHQAVPLPFVSGVGAAVQAGDWKMQRHLQLPSVENLYSLTLTAADLAALREDLGDLRLVNHEDKQIPFLLEHDGHEAEVFLQVEKQVGRVTPGQRGTISDYRLSAEINDKAVMLPLRSLRLEVAELFFSRRARLIERADDPRHRERVLFDGVLARSGDSTAPVVIGLDGVRRQEMFLEIEEGDNAPLTLQQVIGKVSVPRLAFKLGEGQTNCRLLLGNSHAHAPSYDLQSLRQQVLNSVAVPVPSSRFGSLEPNPAYRHAAADYFKGGQSAGVLWGALLVAVVVLLALTVRLLKKPL